MKSKSVISIALLLLFGIVMAAFKPVQADNSLPSFAFKAPMPTARGQAAIIAGDDGLIYAIGGLNQTVTSDVLDVVEAYNPPTDSWTTKAALLNATRGAAVAIGLDGIIYVFGGYDVDSLGIVQAYNTTSDTWVLKDPMPTPVWMAGAATGNDGKIYVIGGENPFGSEIATLQIYDPEADTWTTGPSMPASRSQLGVIKGSDGRIYAMGGWDGSSAQDDIYIYDPILDEWGTPFLGMPMPTPRLEFGLTLGADEKFYIIGGGTSYFNNQPPVFDRVDAYDTHVILSWSFEGLMPTASKELGAATATNGKIYIIGGSNGTHYVDTNIEMTVIAEPENQPPTAYIDSITPNPSTKGETVSFVGHGSDIDGTIKGYKWRSSIDGTIGTTASFDTATLSNGTHTIYFSVKDNNDAWSAEAMAAFTVNINYTEDPNYQEIVKLEQAVDDLEAQIENLNTTIGDLNRKLDLMTLELLGTGIVILILVVVAVTVVYITRVKKAPLTMHPAE
jgi:N-acetylneuraminic acid mutarotase